MKTPKSPLSLRKDDAGAVMIIGLFMALGLIGFTWFMIGVGKAFLFRERAQEAADSVAMGAAIIQARGMNIIAAINVFLMTLTFGFLSFRMMEALFYHLAQVVGLPVDGFGPSKFANQEVAANNFEPSGKCAQLQAGGYGGHTPNMSVSINLGSKPGILQSGWACADSGRYQAFLDTTGITNLPADMPKRVVAVHNTIRAINMFIEESNNKMVDALLKAQDDATKNFAETAGQYADFMAIDFDSAYFGGLLPNMKNAIDGKATGFAINRGRLPIQTDGTATGQGGNLRKLNALCLRTAEDASFAANGFALDGTPRIHKPVMANDAVVVNGTSFRQFFLGAVTQTNVTRDFWCDNVATGARLGANYWSDRHYAFFPDGLGEKYENGGDAFLVRSKIGGTFTDTNRRPQGIVARMSAGTEEEANSYFAASEFYFACDERWDAAGCNGRISGGQATGADMTLFRTNWAARLIRATGAGGTGGGLIGH